MLRGYFRNWQNIDIYDAREHALIPQTVEYPKKGYFLILNSKLSEKSITVKKIL